MRDSRGFTLIELLVVSAIIVIVSGIILVNNNRFGGVIQLENLAYDVALSIRQAQVYGISVQRFGSSTFSAGYGVHFDISSPNTYITFADALTANGLYDCPSPGTSACELVQSTTITQGYHIQALCVTPPVGAEDCTVHKVDALFVRPEPDAWISGSDTSCVLQHGTCQEGARVVLISPRGETMSVIVEANGQIAVRRGPQ